MRLEHNTSGFHKPFISIGTIAWNTHDVKYNPQTINHQLGHVFNMLAGAGGSRFVYDVNPVTFMPDADAQAKNADLESICIH